MKKKLLALALALTLLLVLAVPALAAAQVELPLINDDTDQHYSAPATITTDHPNIIHLTTADEAPEGWSFGLYIYDAILSDLAPGYPTPEAGYTLLVQYSPDVFPRMAELPPYLDDAGEFGMYDPSYTYDFTFTLPVPDGYDPATARYYRNGFLPVAAYDASTVSIPVTMYVDTSSAAGFIMGYADKGGLEEVYGLVVEYQPLGAPAVPTIVSTGLDPQDSGTAKESTQPVNIGGQTVQLQAYALTNEKGDQTNYVKVRDVAAALDGTAAQFDVQWDGAVNLVTGTAYASRNGQENQTPYSGDRGYTKATAETKVNGVVVPLQAFILLDDNGNGSTYYKLRDLGQALGFNVGWDKDRGIFLEPGVPYDPNN